MRGVGRTTNMIDNLPTGRCMVVTSKPDLCREFKKLTEEFRGKEFTKNVKFVTISEYDDCSKLYGYSNPVFFDHSFFDSVDFETAKHALELAHGASIIYHIGKTK